VGSGRVVGGSTGWPITSGLLRVRMKDGTEKEG
jgi:hypothetical protein